MVFYMPINEIQFKMLVNMQQRFKARLIPSGKARVIRAVKWVNLIKKNFWKTLMII